jgi:hypothetical protein
MNSGIGIKSVAIAKDKQYVDSKKVEDGQTAERHISETGRIPVT